MKLTKTLINLPKSFRRKILNDAEKIANSDELSKRVIIGEDNELYHTKLNGKIYPISHPDLSTQPSILPQRFGNLDIKEVLIANGRENEIPINAMVIEAFSFNKNQCITAFCEKNGKSWSITNDKNVIPDYTLVRYVGEDKGYYYYNNGEDKGYYLGYAILNDNSFVDIYSKDGVLRLNNVIDIKDNTKEFYIHDGVQYIDNDTFSSSPLEKIDIPNSINYIGAGVFANCINLKLIVIPNNVSVINESTFRSCTSLESITLPSIISRIYMYAFDSCTSLKDVYCYSNVPPMIDNNAFYYVDLSNVVLHVPDGTVALYTQTDVWKDFGDIAVIE